MLLPSQRLYCSLLADPVSSAGEAHLPARDELCLLEASEALRRFGDGSLSPVELLGAITDRIERVEPHVNAFSELMLDTALDQAKASANRWARGTALPLDGITVAVKEEQPIAGRTLEYGSRAHQGEFSEVSHPVVDRLRAAGAVIVGRTTTPEFSCAFFTHSDLWGITRNPANLAYSPGGSSGGSGAALAAGMATVATGSDIAGSIRVPASMCGVVGLKPSYGRVASLPSLNLDAYCHDGPMARSSADIALLMDVIAGSDLRDPASLPSRVVVPAEVVPAQRPDGTPLRVAVVTRLGDYPVDEQVQRAVIETGALLEAAGAVVEHAELPWSWESVAETAWIHYGHLFTAELAIEVEAYPGEVMGYTRQFVERGLDYARGHTFFDGLVREMELWTPLAQLFATYDVVLCPTVAHTGLLAGDDYVDHGVMVEGRSVDPWDVAMTVPFSIASRCPALSTPAGVAHNGVPIGVQVVGRPYDEATVLRVGTLIEQLRR